MTIKQNPNRLDAYAGVPDKEPRIRKKKCKKCKEFKPITEFNKDKTRNDGLFSYCKKCCLNHARKITNNYRKINKNKMDEEIFHGKLIRCGGTYLISKIKSHYLPATKENFNKDNTRKIGIQNMCRKCRRINQIESRYKIPFNIYEKMYKEQKGKCLICKIYKKKLYVDHDHKTGKVRGLLCNICNRNLGHLESKNFVKKSIKYLKKYNSDIEHLKI